MDEERKKAFLGMTPGEQAARFQELGKKLGIAEPASIAGGRKPLESSLDENEEYQFLKRRLSHS